MRAYLIAAAGALTLTASLASAQDAAQPPALTEGHLATAAGDGDKAVSQDEFRALMKRAHETLDKDADGVVTWVEAQDAILREHFDAIDANKDGRITAAEMDAQAQADFASSDRDGDGALN